MPKRLACRRWAPVLVAVAFGAAAPGLAWAQASCRVLRYSFEPDCFQRDAAGACRFDVQHPDFRPDFGPQVAVWIESADGTAFVDTLLVTNAVGLYGIGNRPGRSDLRSGPRFPYGRRPMALPVWAARRGKLYDAVAMDDGREGWMSTHEEVSSPEPYFCRPMTPAEIVDAVTCASGRFRSAKGIFDHTVPQSYYPPRGDLVDWGSICVPNLSGSGSACDYGDARQFGVINDLDVVAAATPAYDRTFAGSWTIPATLAAGDYALMVEVNKEFDANDAFASPSYIDPDEAPIFDGYGLDGNLGQPSIVYRLPFTLSEAPIAAASVAAAIGYGDPGQPATAVAPLDDRISDVAGSGRARLRVGDGPGGPGAVHLVEASCAALDCSVAPPPEAPRVDEPTALQDATAATFTFRQSADGDGAAEVIAYDLRYTIAQTFNIDESSFAGWAPAAPPDVAPPGTLTSVTVTGLTPYTGYAIGLRAKGACGWSQPAVIRVHTAKQKFAQLSGCVVATAAFGSDMDPDVALLRRQRDWAVARSAMVRLAAVLYAEDAPPLARLVGRSDTARALVRWALRPALALDQAAQRALAP